MNTVSLYSDLQVNIGKIKVVLFMINKTKQEPETQNLSKNTRYLEIVLTQNGSLKTAITTLPKQTNISIF